MVSRRFVKKKQMPWTPNGPLLLLRTRTTVSNTEIEDAFRRGIHCFESRGIPHVHPKFLNTIAWSRAALPEVAPAVERCRMLLRGTPRLKIEKRLTECLNLWQAPYAEAV